MRPPAGRMLVELAVLLPLLGILGAGVCSLFVTQVRMARHTQANAGTAELVRVGAGVLREELRWLRPDRDLLAWSRDSIRIRALRATAIPCRGAAGEGPYRVSGLRAPDPAKDSVLALGSAGESVHRLVSIRDTTGCGGIPEDAQFWVLDPPAPVGSVLIAFEIGTYSLAEGAVRYRTGAGGRQPLTEALLDVRASGLAARGAHSVGGGVPHTMEVRLSPLRPVSTLPTRTTAIHWLNQ